MVRKKDDKEYMKLYSKKFRDKNPNYFKEWRKNNKDKVKDYYKNVIIPKRHLNKKVKILLTEEQKKEKQKIYKLRWIERNLEKRRISSKEWDRRNPDKVREKIRRRYARRKGAIINYTEQEWKDKINKTLGICPMCNLYVGINKLELDHIKPLSKIEKGFIYTIKDIQPLCMICNRKKSNKELIC